MSSHPFDYVKFYKDKLNEIEKKINSDFDRGARGSQFVKYINWKRLQITSEILKKLGIDTTYFNINLKRFELVDVTEKLMNIFREAKRDGEALKAKYPMADPSMQIFKTIKYCNTKEDDEKVTQTINLLIDFANLVKSRAKYDIKRRCSWIRDLQYIFDGYIIDYDDTGNMTFGVIARAAGMSQFVLHGGAGIYNAFELFKNSKGNDERLQSLKVDLDRISSFGDDPRDYRAIELGIKYYYKI
ncbi:MAG: polymorphic toxin type 44 domain-containing protein [Clostridia bacterium]|jgi:hypothetical protein|nr:polymorphic toxin type 44 domain-containing protein [Clostridia bacterium]